MANPEMLFDRWDAIALKVLHLFFQYTDEPFPSWLERTIDNSNVMSSTENRIDSLRAIFVDLINEIYLKNFRDSIIADRMGPNPDMTTKIVVLVENHNIPHFRFNSKGQICVFSSIVDVLKSKRLPRITLKDLAALLEFRYDDVKVNGKVHKAAIGSLQDFVGFLLPTVEEPINRLMS